MEEDNRRLLGSETIITVTGDKKDVKVYAMGFIEKLHLIKKYTNTKYINGYSYKEVDEMSIMIEILTKCVQGCTVHELDFNAQELYDKYFKSRKDEEKEKKEDTSTTMLSVTK